MNPADAVLNYICTQLAKNDPAINEDTQLFSEGFLDSTAMLELILWIGDTFELVIQNEDLTPENFASVRNMVEFIERNTDGKLLGRSEASVTTAQD
jgi:acyl carrier protein